MAAKKDKRRIKLLKRIAANPRRITPLVPGRESDYVFEDDPNEKQAMLLEQRRRNDLSKLRRLESRWEEQEREYREHRIAVCKRMIEDDLKAIAKLS